MTFKRPTSLLSKNNAKTIKGEKLGYTTYIMYMSPFTQNSKGINLCPQASKGCAEACLFSSGMGGIYTNVEQGRINKSEYFIADRQAFLEQLYNEIAKVVKTHNAIQGDKVMNKKGTDVLRYKKFAIRLNGTTDLSWEKLIIKKYGKSIIDLFPNVQFYDYTKNHFRFNKPLPANYHLTFSRSENNHDIAMDLLSRGVNVAMVFDKLPTNFEGFEVINGDKSDLRFLDKSGAVVGLVYKKITKKGADNEAVFKTGFGIRVSEYATVLA